MSCCVCSITPGFCACPALVAANAPTSSVAQSGAISPSIGTPSQTPGTNPSTTIALGSAPVTTNTGLAGIVNSALGSLIAQGTYSANQAIAKATNTNTLQSSIGGTGLVLIILVVGIIWLFTQKKA